MRGEIFNKNNLLVLLILISIFSFFFGFYFEENSAGGGKADFNNTWRNLQMFETNDLFTALSLTASNDGNVFQSSRIPGVYIFHKLFNPFTENIFQFKLSVTLLSLLVPVFFFKALTLRFQKIEKVNLALISCLLLLSPYFRTSAFWGNEENFGLLSLILSYIFLKKYLITNERNFEISYLIFLGFFSSLCIYFDQKLAFIPIVCLLMILKSQKESFDKIILIVIYTIMSFPILYLFYLWGSILPPIDASGRGMSLYSYNFQHIGYVSSIIFFYLIPFFLTDISQFKNFFDIKIKNNKLVFLISFIFILYFLFFHDLNKELSFGNGVFFKLSSIFFTNQIYQKIFLSLIFVISFFILSNILKKDLYNYFIFIFLVFASIIYKPVLQEYFDPLIIILIFTFVLTKFSLKSSSLIISYFYFLSFLIFSNIYYYKLCLTSPFC